MTTDQTESNAQPHTGGLGSPARRALIAGGLGLVIGAVIGAGLECVLDSPSSGDDQDPVREDHPLILLSGADQNGARGERIQAWNEWVAAWNRQFPDRLKPHVIVVWLPSSANEQLAEMIRRADSDAEDVDVFVLDAPWTRQFALNDRLQELSPTVDTRQFLRRPLESCTVDGKLYALPFNSDAGLLFRHANLPAPTTWDALVAAAHADASPTRAPSAVGGQFGRGEAFVVNVLEGVLARGGRILDTQGNLLLSGQGVPPALRALARDLGDVAHIPSAADEYDEAASQQAFTDGTVAYMRNWPAFTPRTTEQTLPPHVRVGNLPWPSVLGGQNLAVAVGSRYTRSATELVEWLTSDSSQFQLFQKGGYAATRSAVYHDPAIRDDAKYPYVEELLAAIDSALSRPAVRNYPLLSQTFETVMRRVLANGGDLTPADAAQIEAAVDGRIALS